MILLRPLQEINHLLHLPFALVKPSNILELYFNVFDYIEFLSLRTHIGHPARSTARRTHDTRDDKKNENTIEELEGKVQHGLDTTPSLVVVRMALLNSNLHQLIE